MKKNLTVRFFFLFFAVPLAAQEPSRTDPAAQQPAAQETPAAEVRIKPKGGGTRDRGEGGPGPSEAGLLQPDVSLVDAPTTAVLDYGGYSSQSRFFDAGGVLQSVSFGVFQRLNIGASLTIDHIVGSERVVRVRAPNVQVKYRFYDGDRRLPSLALGFDGQGYLYNQPIKRYNQRQRGFFVVGTQELGLPGFLFHPSINVSDFDSNDIYGALPLSYNIQDKVLLMVEWDNIRKGNESRLNSGARVYVTPRFHLDFAVRSIGQAGLYSDGTRRGPERIVQIKYSNSF